MQRCWKGCVQHVLYSQELAFALTWHMPGMRMSV